LNLQLPPIHKKQGKRRARRNLGRSEHGDGDRNPCKAALESLGLDFKLTGSLLHIINNTHPHHKERIQRKEEYRNPIFRETPMKLESIMKKQEPLIRSFTAQGGI